MIITPSGLVTLQTNLNLTYSNAFNDTPTWYQKITNITGSTGRLTHYPVFDRGLGKMRKWVGERVIQGQSIYDLIIANSKFEGTVSLLREDIEDNAFDVANMTADNLGREAKVFADQQITLLVEGNAATGYDQLPIYSNAHPLNDGSANTQSNLFSSATSGARPLNNANLAFALTAWRNLKGVDGAPLATGARPVLMVPASLEFQARSILNLVSVAPSVAVGAGAAGAQQSNVLYGAADLVINPWLTSQTAWYLFDASQAQKPFVYQIRTPMEFVSMDAATTDNSFLRDEYLYGVRHRAGFGVSLWYLTVKADV